MSTSLDRIKVVSEKIEQVDKVNERDRTVDGSFGPVRHQ